MANLSDMRAGLELLDERRFSNGVVYLRYRYRSTERTVGAAPAT